MLTENRAWLHRVEYDSVNRCHRVDGQLVPSVTQVLTAAHPDRFRHVPPGLLARKAAIGTAVHQAAQYHAEHDLDAASLAGEVNARFAAWEWFARTRQVQPILCEAVVCSRDLGLEPSRRRPYIGRLDFLCLVDRSRLVLLDLKTGSPLLAGLQTLAYLDALYQQYPNLIRLDVQRWAVVLGADRRYSIRPYHDDAGDHLAFRDALERVYADMEISNGRSAV